MNTYNLILNIYTPYASAPLRCTPVASPVDSFAQSAYLVPNYASPANRCKSVFYPGHKETLSPGFLEKLVVPTEIEYFQHDSRSSE